MTTFKTAATAVAATAVLAGCASMPQGVQDLGNKAVAAASDAASSVRSGASGLLSGITNTVNPTVTFKGNTYELTTRKFPSTSEGHSSAQLGKNTAVYAAITCSGTPSVTVAALENGSLTQGQYNNGKVTTTVNGKVIKIESSAIPTGTCLGSTVHVNAPVNLLQLVAEATENAASRPDRRVVFPSFGLTK